MSDRDRRIVIVGCVVAHIAAVCLSFVYASVYRPELTAGDPLQGSMGLWLMLAALIPLAWAFGSTQFSFGYVVGFYLYQMVAGFLFLNAFTIRDYNHYLAGASALISTVAFLVPALMLRARPKALLSLAPRTFDRFLLLILALGIAVILLGMVYSFRADFGSFADFRNELLTARLRNELKLPALLRYGAGVFSSSLIPFVFACFLLRQQYLKAVASLVLLALFFPITLSKSALFTPAWLLFIALLGRLFEIRLAAVLSLAIPLLVGVLAALLGQHENDAFRLFAFRMIDTPAAALAVYNEFFARHEPTYFCHLSFVKALVDCPYQDQLGVVMAHAYGLGNYNASLFATEGIASVGMKLAPLSALICGLVVALGNSASARLPPSLVFISSSVMSQVILNVPLSTAFITHGCGVLFLLWYISPPEVFSKEPAADLR
ncbi:hypothetical protein [Bradyrhizobium cenepequi]|uniref:hypothetical protein n=1 Tax=Bradyrhizobium cenepequi TaxID=2821403 RepID=UPI001CE38C54|nr:hypothetical protein [Bradyrhizobium cenepequi]MCA6106944.1 hypothetical protein [Bradyrhizobium cenepequi]